MSLWKAIALLVYFFSFTALTVYLAYGLWAAEPIPAQWESEGAFRQSKAQTPGHQPTEAAPQATDAGPEITSISPNALTMGTGQVSIQILGANFTKDSTVKFNGSERKKEYVDQHQLVVLINTAEFAAPGPVTVTVTNNDKTSGASILRVRARDTLTGKWGVFGCEARIRQESRLLLLVLFTGALGACISGMKSLADYIGNEKLTESWFTFYAVQPWLGAGIGLIFYLVIRGGFVSVSSFDAGSVNPFGVTAVAALVGMFSDKALLKLSEVFITLFKADDTRSGKLGKLAITNTGALPDAHVNTAYAQKLVATGGTAPYAWSAITPLPRGLTLNAATGDLTGTPTAAAPKTLYTFRVTDSSQSSANVDLSLTVA